MAFLNLCWAIILFSHIIFANILSKWSLCVKTANWFGYAVNINKNNVTKALVPMGEVWLATQMPSVSGMFSRSWNLMQAEKLRMRSVSTVVT